MKKGLTLLCSGLMLVSLAACSSNSKKESSSKETKKTEQVAHKKSKKETKKKTTASSHTASKADLGNSKEFSIMVKGAQSQIPAMKKKFGSVFKDIAIEEGKDSTIIYKYVFSKALDKEVDVEALKPELIEECKPMIEQVKSIIPDIKIGVKYLNPDGSDIASFTITQEDIEKAE